MTPGRTRDVPKPEELLPLTPAVFHILLALSDGPRHGLGIADDVESRTAGAVSFGPGTLYGTLKRMLESELVAESKQRPAASRDDPRRRYYRITRRGARLARLEARRLAMVLEIARDKNVYSDA